MTCFSFDLPIQTSVIAKVEKKRADSRRKQVRSAYPKFVRLSRAHLVSALKMKLTKNIDEEILHECCWRKKK